MSRKPLSYLQECLRKKGVERVTGHFKVKLKLHPKYPNLHMFKYDQINSPMGSKIVQACRGIILDADNDWEPVCHSYDKFFNVQEGHAAKIDWHTARVYEKLDGSLMQLYWYDDQWHVATSGTPDADCEVPFGNTTFKDLFWQTWGDLGYDLPTAPIGKFCYAFELMTKYNHVVVRHEEPRLVCHGVRDPKSGYEGLPPVFCCLNWEFVKTFDFDFDNTTAALLKMNGSTCEGFVIVDENMNRVKMKCEDYVKKHRLASSLSERNMLDLVRSNEGTEFLSYFPEWKEVYDEIKVVFDKLVLSVEKEYNDIKHIKDQKEFAEKAKQCKLSGTLFKLRSGKVDSVRESLAKINIRQLEGLMEKQ